MVKRDLPKSALIIEDDPDVIEVVRLNISDIGLELDSASDGETGAQKAISNEYALIILDLNLPRLGGIEVCRRIREHNREVPIIMLTSRTEEVNKVLGLEVGADDYLAKPFSVAELLARLKALLRRSYLSSERSADAESEKLNCKDLEIDLARRQVRVRESIVQTTPREYELLVFLAGNPGRPFTREQISRQAWGEEFSGYDHTVSAHVNRLRAKLESDPANPEYIQTVFGVGYKFPDPESE